MKKYIIKNKKLNLTREIAFSANHAVWILSAKYLLHFAEVLLKLKETEHQLKAK